MDFAEAEPKCRKAFERRFGASLLPLSVKPGTDGNGTVHVRDLESGTWAVYDIRFWRIRRLRDSEQIDQILAESR